MAGCGVFWILLSILPAPIDLTSHPFPVPSDLHAHPYKSLGLGEANMGKLAAWQSQSVCSPQRRAHRAWFWRGEKQKCTASLSFSWHECCLGSSIPLASQLESGPKDPTIQLFPHIQTHTFVQEAGHQLARVQSPPQESRPSAALVRDLVGKTGDMWGLCDKQSCVQTRWNSAVNLPLHSSLAPEASVSLWRVYMHFRGYILNKWLNPLQCEHSCTGTHLLFRKAEQGAQIPIRKCIIII